MSKEERVMANYKYKLVWETFARPEELNEKKFEDLRSMKEYLVQIIMIIKSANVYWKLKGKYELIYNMDGHIYNPEKNEK